VGGYLIAPGVLIGLALIQALLTLRDRRRFPAPGQMINGLHVIKLGEGAPAIVFESGMANSSLSWSLIQPQVAKSAQTYSYDRAGFGWSPSVGESCSLDSISKQLHGLIEILQVPRPFVLVGHSFGGYIARCYAHHFPAELAGLVLVDPATPEEWMDPNPQQQSRLRRAIFYTRASGVLACFGIVRFGLWLLLLRKKETPGPLSRFSQTLQRIRNETRKIPANAMPFIRAHWSRPGFYWAMARYLRAVPACARAASCCPTPSGLPITVLSGAHQPPELLAAQAAMATRHIVAAASAHFIHFDEPELVVSAILNTLAMCRTSAGEPRS
jgi:pimeloyl-ACP methyl ester carboxylesterase